MQTVESLEYLCKLLRNNPVDEYAQLQKDIVNENIPWLEIIEIANIELLIPALHYSLYEKELIDDIPDEQLKEYLSEVFLMNTKRNEAILLQLKEVTHICAEINTSSLILKGAAALIENDYPHIGVRSMTDIDIMPITTEFTSVIFHFQLHDYQPFDFESTPSIFEDDNRHDWKLTKQGAAAMLELHVRIDENYLIPFSPEISCASQTKSLERTFVLTPTYRLFHAFIHTEISNEYYQNKHIGVRHLYDFYVLVHKYETEIDWTLLMKLIRNINADKIFRCYLYTAYKLFNLRTPVECNFIYAKFHYKMIQIRFNQNRNLLHLFFFTLFQLHIAFSYKSLKKRYRFKSKFFYPFAIIKHFSYLIKKYTLL